MKTAIETTDTKEVCTLVNEASNIIETTIKKVNWEIIKMHWNIGKLVNDYRKDHNSKWGDGIVIKFSEELRLKYGNGFSRQNINRMCLFNQKFEIGHPGAQIGFASPGTQTK